MSGFIGGRLLPALRGDGHDVVQLVRKGPTHAGQRLWNPHVRRLDPDVLDGVDAVIDMCGANIGDDRWTAKYSSSCVRRGSTPRACWPRNARRAGFRSCSTRAESTTTARGSMPRSSPSDPSPGRHFSLCCASTGKAATLRAAEAGTRVVTLRTSPVVGREADLVMQLGTVTQLMMGGRLGSGYQLLP